MPKKADADNSGEFLTILEKGVKAVLNNPDATASERVAAVTAGSKLLMIRHRIKESDGTGFFDS
jgi:hypothetical protein